MKRSCTLIDDKLWVGCLMIAVLAVFPFTEADAAETLEIRAELWVDGPEAVQPGVDRDAPAVAVDASGRSVVAWTAFGDDRHDVWVRRFDADDQPLGDPVQVNTLTADDQRYPRLALRPDGKLLVVWQSEEPDTTQVGNPSRFVIRGRLLNNDLSAAGSEYLLSTLSTDLLIDVSVDVAPLSNNGFAVVWESNQSVGDDDESKSIQGRIVASNGLPTGSQFQVNDLISGGQRDSAVSALSAGGFLVVWAGRSDGTDTGTSIQGRRFSNAGAALATDFQINTTTDGTQDNPDVSVDSAGNLLAVWTTPTAETSRTQVFARFLGNTGSPTGSDFQVHPTNDLDHQLDPRVAAGKVNRFLVTWHSDTGPGGDADRSVQARLVAGEGVFTTAQFQVNGSRAGKQFLPAVAGTSARLMVVYRDDNNPFAVNDDGIVASGMDLCFFCDDFESGGTSAWSSVVP
jgi:hypothetical protein